MTSVGGTVPLVLDGSTGAISGGTISGTTITGSDFKTANYESFTGSGIAILKTSPGGNDSVSFKSAGSTTGSITNSGMGVTFRSEPNAAGNNYLALVRESDTIGNNNIYLNSGGITLQTEGNRTTTFGNTLHISPIGTVSLSNSSGAASTKALRNIRATDIATASSDGILHNGPVTTTDQIGEIVLVY